MDRTETAKAEAAKRWQCPQDQVFAEDASQLYPWLKQNAVVLVKNLDQQAVLVVVSADNQPTPIGEGRELAENLRVLNRVLEMEKVRLPGGIPVGELAVAVRHFLAGPGGHVADKAFLERHRKLVEMSSRGDAKHVQLFQESCRDPVLESRDARWHLNFVYLNNRGGVEEWNVEGDANSIHKAASRALSPDRTFSLPYG